MTDEKQREETYELKTIREQTERIRMARDSVAFVVDNIAKRLHVSALEPTELAGGRYYETWIRMYMYDDERKTGMLGAQALALAIKDFAPQILNRYLEHEERYLLDLKAHTLADAKKIVEALE